MDGSPNILIAFLGGVIAFLSPCILPLIPSYLSFIGGVSYGELVENKKKNWGLFFKSLFFVLGFTIIFVVLGIAFSGMGMAFANATKIINIVAGIIVILLGLNFIFNFIKILNVEKRFHMKKMPKGFIGPILLGMAFGAGWTPCVGPILASILAMASNSKQVLEGTFLLIFFSLGLGLPFMLGGLFFSSFQAKLQRIKPLMGKIKIVSGIFLVFVGILLFSGSLSEINILFFKAAYGLQEFGESNPFLSAFIPGIFFTVLFLLIALFYGRRVVKKKKEGKEGFPVLPVRIVFMTIFLVLGILAYTGAMNFPLLISSWFTFQGI